MTYNSTLREDLNNLQMSDTFSLILFALYKLQDIPEYSTISELAYILDKEALLNVCEYFGGITIRIPTVDELESVINSLLMYQYIDLDGYSYDDAVAKIGFESYQLRKVKKDYLKVKQVLSQYSLK